LQDRNTNLSNSFSNKYAKLQRTALVEKMRRSAHRASNFGPQSQRKRFLAQEKVQVLWKTISNSAVNSWLVYSLNASKELTSKMKMRRMMS